MKIAPIYYNQGRVYVQHMHTENTMHVIDAAQKFHSGKRDGYVIDGRTFCVFSRLPHGRSPLTYQVLKCGTKDTTVDDRECYVLGSPPFHIMPRTVRVVNMWGVDLDHQYPLKNLDVPLKTEHSQFDPCVLPFPVLDVPESVRLFRLEGTRTLYALPEDNISVRSAVELRAVVNAYRKAGRPYVCALFRGMFYTFRFRDGQLGAIRRILEQGKETFDNGVHRFAITNGYHNPKRKYVAMLH